MIMIPELISSQKKQYFLYFMSVSTHQSLKLCLHVTVFFIAKPDNLWCKQQFYMQMID